MHRPARQPVPLNKWRHVAVVCDGRPGGEIRFYLDGQRDCTSQLGVAVPLDLDAFRLGAWKNWQDTPDNNYHGGLDEVRIYRGMLD